MKTNIVKYQNNKNSNTCIERAYFHCLCVTVEEKDADSFTKLLKTAEEAYGAYCNKEANTANIRNSAQMIRSVYSGLVAEQICLHFLNRQYDGALFSQPEMVTVKNQIDLLFSQTNRSFEVRSSFIHNGILFALFAQKDQEQYIDVIGPYANAAYKKGEKRKDYYLRVLYPGYKEDALTAFTKGYRFFLTGGATAKMMWDPELSKIKPFTPEDGIVKEAGNFRVVPLGKSLDILEFMKKLEEENFLLKEHRVADNQNAWFNYCNA